MFLLGPLNEPIIDFVGILIEVDEPRILKVLYQKRYTRTFSKHDMRKMEE